MLWSVVLHVRGGLPAAPEYMSIAKELEVHAGEELQHALIVAKQIDYLGGQPVVAPNPVKTSDKARDMLQFDLDNENETIRNYRERVRPCEALGEYALSEQIRAILVQEQEHQIDLATALGKDILAAPSNGGIAISRSSRRRFGLPSQAQDALTAGRIERDRFPAVPVRAPEVQRA
jgi:bacterioferritin (cytochrome b1)